MTANAGTLAQARDRLRPYVERARLMTGWTWEYVQRTLAPGRPWSYDDRARELLRSARSVVDLGTGGGERFSGFLSGFNGRACATEEWVVNAPVAARRLRPLGVDVVHCSSLTLPFSGGSFDLVLDRHEALDPAEVARVLAPGGSVLTQQVGPENWPELRRFFPRMLPSPADIQDHFALYQEGFRGGGLTLIDARKHYSKAAFENLGVLVYVLCVVADWTIPAFDPLGVDLEALLDVERELSSSEGIVLTEGQYIIEARKMPPI